MTTVCNISQQSQQKNKNLALIKPKNHLSFISVSLLRSLRPYFINTTDEGFIKIIQSIKNSNVLDIYNCIILFNGKTLSRNTIKERTKLSFRTIDRSLKILCDKRILQRINKGYKKRIKFYVHPLLNNYKIRQALGYKLSALRNPLSMEENFYPQEIFSDLKRHGKVYEGILYSKPFRKEIDAHLNIYIKYNKNINNINNIIFSSNIISCNIKRTRNFQKENNQKHIIKNPLKRNKIISLYALAKQVYKVEFSLQEQLALERYPLGVCLKLEKEIDNNLKNGFKPDNFIYFCLGRARKLSLEKRINKLPVIRNIEKKENIIFVTDKARKWIEENIQKQEELESTSIGKVIVNNFLADRPYLTEVLTKINCLEEDKSRRFVIFNEEVCKQFLETGVFPGGERETLISLSKLFKEYLLSKSLTPAIKETNLDNDNYLCRTKGSVMA